VDSRNAANRAARYRVGPSRDVWRVPPLPPFALAGNHAPLSVVAVIGTWPDPTYEDDEGEDE